MQFGTKILYKELLFEKRLFKTDVSTNCRLAIPKKVAEEYILKYFTHDQLIQVKNEGMLFPIINLDKGIEQKLVLKQQATTKTYVLLGGWMDFVRLLPCFSYLTY